ncbi:hypothetical protein HK102_012309 [Quaeritorhiza haematococci]|nr:hypothetical protein HK102_012309 [Quaeritorhiza haematococci]
MFADGSGELEHDQNETDDNQYLPEGLGIMEGFPDGGIPTGSRPRINASQKAPQIPSIHHHDETTQTQDFDGDRSWTSTGYHSVGVVVESETEYSGDERSPLLQGAVQHKRAAYHGDANQDAMEAIVYEAEHTAVKSTFAQATFNSVNVLMGIGILSLPFAFRLTGWILGMILLSTSCLMTRYTAILLSRCMDYEDNTSSSNTVTTTTHLLNGHQPSSTTHHLRRRKAETYADMGEMAFGTRGRLFISAVFLSELFAATVALVILMADSVVALFPSFDSSLVKCAAVALVIPTTWPRSLSMLAYGSLLGIVALLNLLCIILVDGSTTEESPGSLINPAETHLWPPVLFAVPLSFGLIMAGFAGHSVLPNIYRDMREPQHYPKMVDLTYVVVAAIYIVIAASGYIMFGDATMQEITQNLPQVPSYNKMLTQVTVWLVAVNPATKYALTINPVNVSFAH